MNISSVFYHGSDREVLFHVKSLESLESRTNKKLYENVNSICLGLTDLGIKKGDRVLILTGITIETVELLLAVFNLGAVAVPVNPYSSVSSLKEIVESTKPVCCVSEKTPRDGTLVVLQNICNIYITIRRGTHVKNDNWYLYDDLVMKRSPGIRFNNFEDSTLALIVHTSGSEGKSKVIRLTHKNLTNFFDFHNLIYSQYFNDTEPDRPIVSIFPFHHLAGISTCFQGLLMNRPTYLLSHFEPRLYLGLIAQIKCHYIALVSSMYMSLLNEKKYLEEVDLSSLKICVALGESCPDELAENIEKNFGVIVVSAYGCTECLPGIVHAKEDIDKGSIKRGSVGKVLFEEIKLVDNDGIEREDAGELWVRNPTVYRCYMDENLNNERFQDGWFKTKDLFCKDESGNYFHKGRCDDMFVCNGKNIYPTDIERVLIKNPSIDMVCAGPIKNNKNKVIPAVLVKLKTPMDKSDIINYFIKHGPLHAVPQLVMIEEELPLSGPGKINRKEVKRMLQDYSDMQA